MGIPSLNPDSDYLGRSAGLDNVATSITPLHWYSGGLSAVPKGVVGGLAAMGRVGSDAMAKMSVMTPELAMGLDPGISEEMAQYMAHGDTKAPWDESLKHVQEWAKMDPRTTGFVPNLAASTSRGLTIAFTGSLLGGPLAGAAALGVTEGYSDWLESGDAGIDDNTRLKKAGLTGATAFAGAFLPMKVSKNAALGLAGLGMQAEIAGNQALAGALYKSAQAASKMTSLTARLASGAAINTGFGMANRYTTSQLLESAGYKDMASQYKALDAGAMVADAVLGMAFGGWGHMEDNHATSRPTRDMVDGALEARRQEMISRSGPGLPTDPVTAMVDMNLQDRAVSALIREQPVDISLPEASRVIDNVISDPQRAEIHQDFLDANRAVHGAIMDFTPPEMLPARPEPPLKPEAPKPPAPPAPAGEGTAKMGSLAQETLDQLVARHPDMEIGLPDGRTIKMADMPDLMKQEMAAKQNEAKLYETALGCFLRTSL